jgi:hypothetical protein
VPEHEERAREESDCDDDPDSLPERIGGVEPVDLRQADCGQQAGDRQQVRVGERNGVPRGEMRDEIDRKEEARIRQRGRRDDVLTSDVDAGKPDGRQDPDDDQEGELTIPRAERQRTNLR